MTKIFLLPDLGEGLTESDIVQWRVREGDTVRRNDVLADVETAKATVELPSPFDGRIAKLHADEGETVLVGAPLVEFDVEDAGSAEATPVAPDGSSTDATDADTSADTEADEPAPLVLVGSGPKERPGASRRARTWTVAPFTRSRREHTAPVRSTPPVRALARSLGIDLASVAGSGPEGRVERADLERATRPSQSAHAVPAERREPVKGIRKATAQAMTDAWAVPQACVFHRADVTETRALARGAEGVSFFALVCRAIVLAAASAPGANAWFDAERGEIVFRTAVHLGVAIATERGLVVATVRDAQQKTASELTEAIADLAARGRAGQLRPEELSGSTLTVSNVGVFGVESGVPILNPGQSAIVAVGAILSQPWAHAGEVALRDVVQLSCSFDHRVIDGAEAAGFLLDVATLVEQPARAFLR